MESNHLDTCYLFSLGTTMCEIDISNIFCTVLCWLKDSTTTKNETNMKYRWIAHQLQVGTSLGHHRNLVQFQIWDHFWISQPKLHGAMYLIIFVRPTTISFDQFSHFLFFVSVSYLTSILRSAIWAPINVLASVARITSVILVHWILLLKKSKNRCFVL